MRLVATYSRCLRVLAWLGRSVEAIIAPNSCAFCGCPLGIADAPVCAGCFGDLPWIEPQFELAPFTRALAPLEYAFPIDAAIKAFKFRRKLFYAPAFARLLQNSLHLLPENVDAVLPVPLHWRRQVVRGFNQATEIAKPLLAQTGLKLVTNVVRRRPTLYQSGLAAAHRRRNLTAAFATIGNCNARHVLIVDDVITTGATCRELGSLLLRSDVEEVSALAIARAQQD